MLAAPGERRERRSEATATAKVSSSSSSPVGRAKRPDRAETREKYQPLDAETTSLLHGICGRFGHLPPDPSAAYILSIDFGEALEDLARLLGSDEGQVLVRLGEMQVMARHLVPMLVVLSRDRFEGELITVLNLINLLLCSEVEANRASQEVLLDLRRQYKRVFESSAVMEALLNVAVTCVAPQPETAEMDGEILKRVFTLIRNLLAIPDASEQYVAANVSLASTFGRQERLVTHMQEARLIEFLLVAAGSCNDRRDRRLFGPHVPLLLEIFHCMFRVYDPSVIAAMHGFDGDGPQTCAAEEALQRERTIQRPVRHGRFSGTVVVRLSTGEDYVMSSRQLDRSLTLDPGKRIQHRPKKWALEDFGALSSGLRSSEKMAIFRVVLQFIRESFPELAVAFAERLDLQNPQAALEWNALRLMAWTVRFARQVLAADGAGGSADLSLEHLYGAVDASLMIRIARATRRFLNEKQHSLVMASICYFREALRLIDLMAHTAEPVSIAEHAKTIQMEFFYRQEVVGILRLVLHHSQRLSLKMLAVLVEANHVLLKLLHSYCTSRALVFVSTARRGTAGGGGGGGGGGEGKGEDEEEAEDEDEDETGQERQFYFEQFVQDYCTENIIDALVRLLRHADGMDASVNRFVAALIHWILVKVKMPGLFYRVSLLDAIHCCLSSTSLSWRRRNPDLLKVCAAVARSFLRELRRDPTLIVAAFFNPGYAARRAMSRGTSRGEEPRGGRSEPARLPEHWSLEEKLRWLVRSLVDGEQSSTVSWLIGKLYDAAASRTVHSPAEADKTEERSFECYCTGRVALGTHGDCRFVRPDRLSQGGPGQSLAANALGGDWRGGSAGRRAQLADSCEPHSGRDHRTGPHAAGLSS